MFQVVRTHVNVPHRTDHTLFKFDNSLGANKHTTRSPLNVATDSHRQIDAQ